MKRAVLACLFSFALTSPAADSDPPLLLTAYDNEVEEAARLIAAGADPNKTNRYGVAPLSLACTNGNAELVKILLEAGADPNATLNGGETALMTAARTGKPLPVKLLLSHGAELSATDWKGQDALMWAAAEGHEKIVNLFLKEGADADRTLDSGFTPMFFAARNGHRNVVETLLHHGVSPDKASTKNKVGRKGIPKGTTALRLAVENGHFDTAIALLEAEADPNDQRSGYALLHVLTWVRKPNRGDGEDGLPPPPIRGDLNTLDFARLLVERFGADVNLPLEHGYSGGPRFGTRGATPFLLACKTADLPYLKLLRDLGADLSLTNRDETTPLLAAAGVGSRTPEEEAGVEAEAIAVVAWLLELGADVNTVNRNGETAMHGAAYRNWPKMVALLEQNGTDINVWNQKNKHRWTPLLIAQGFRPGNFKPSAETEEAIAQVMLRHDISPPPAPARPIVGTPKSYSR